MDEQRLIGTTIAGKYRVDRLLARGSLSAVFLATQTGMERPVALKILDLRADIDASWLERFAREAQLVSQLRHPNTITIFDYGQSGDDFLYIAMEYVEGASLNRTIRRQGPIDPLRAARIGAAICASLDEAHDRGILHRDLKPSNVMLTTDHRGDEQVRVLDFGVAKVLEAPEVDADLTIADAFIGTPRYASPEQMRRQDLDPRSDLYALGLLLWECVVGTPAVPSVDYGTCIDYHLASTPWRLPADAGCPAGLAAVIERLLRRDRAERYASCEEAQAALEDFIAAPTAGSSAGVDVFGDLACADEFDRMASFDPKGPPRPPAVALRKKSAPAPSAPRQPAPEPAPTPRAASPTEPAHPEPLQLDETPAVRADRARRQADVRAASPAPGAAAHDLRNLLAENRWFVVTAGAIVLVAAVLGAALYGAEPAPPEAPAVALAPDDLPEEPPALVDPTPTLGTHVVLLAIRTAGWQISKPQTTEMSDVVQSNVMASKKSMTANVTVYECQSQDLADALVEGTERGAQAVTFGRTVVRISRGSARTDNGVPSLASDMIGFKEIARREGVVAVNDDAELD